MSGCHLQGGVLLAVTSLAYSNCLQARSQQTCTLHALLHIVLPRPRFPRPGLPCTPPITDQTKKGAGRGRQKQCRRRCTCRRAMGCLPPCHAAVTQSAALAPPRMPAAQNALLMPDRPPPWLYAGLPPNPPPPPKPRWLSPACVPPSPPPPAAAAETAGFTPCTLYRPARFSSSPAGRPVWACRQQHSETRGCGGWQQSFSSFPPGQCVQQGGGGRRRGEGRQQGKTRRVCGAY